MPPVPLPATTPSGIPPVVARTPSGGVRYALRDNMLHLAASTDDGRGAPHAWALVPGARNPQGGWTTATGFDAIYQGAAEPSNRIPVPPGRELQSLSQRYSSTAWNVLAGAAREHLVLVLYEQGEGVGQIQGVPPGLMGGRFGVWGPNVVRKLEWQAIERFLSKATPRQIQRGLLQVDPTIWAPKTNPSPADPFVFVTASCQYPAGALDGSPQGLAGQPRAVGPADVALVRLGDALDTPPPVDLPGRPSLLLILGDQVYADATAGLFDPRRLDDRYRIAYENLRTSLGAHAIYGRLPHLALFDDHEINDNWQAGDAGDWAGAAFGAYVDDQFPDFPVTLGGLPPLSRPHRHQGYDFFLLDTRTERLPRTPQNFDQQSILREGTWKQLEQWLKDTDKHGDTGKSGPPRFIASPSMLLPRLLQSVTPSGQLPAHAHAALLSDSWDGYPASLYRMLALVWAHGGQAPIVFLSGDIHHCCRAEITVSSSDDAGATRTVRSCSIHSSPLYAPYPFANPMAEEFLAPGDKFQFDWGGKRYSCQVSAQFAAPQVPGYARISVMRDSATSWTVATSFEQGLTPKHTYTMRWP